MSLLLLPVLICLWVLDMVRRQDLRLLPSRPIPPLLALNVVAALSFMAGNLPWFVFAQTAPLRAQAAGLAVFLLSAGAFLLVAHQVRDLRWLQRLTWLNSNYNVDINICAIFPVAVRTRAASGKAGRLG